MSASGPPTAHFKMCVRFQVSKRSPHRSAEIKVWFHVLFPSRHFKLVREFSFKLFLDRVVDSMPMVTYFVAFCPLGDQCSWKGKRLGRFLTEAEAREKIKWHLQASTNHPHDEAMAAEDAELADIATEEDEEPKPKSQSRPSRIPTSRSSPYAIADTPSSSSQGSHAIVLQAMIRSEAAARTAARMSRAAAQGFDAEADVLANEISKLRSL